MTKSTLIIEGGELPDQPPTPPDEGPVANREAKWLGWVMFVGLFAGFGLACALLLTDKKLETDVEKAVSAMLPFAVVWVGLILGINQLLTAAASVAKDPHEIAQAAVYDKFLARWNRVWPTLTTSFAVGYFISVMADQHLKWLLSFVGLLFVLVVVLAWASTKELAKLNKEKPLSENAKKMANFALVLRPVFALAYLIPVAMIVGISAVRLH